MTTVGHTLAVPDDRGPSNWPQALLTRPFVLSNIWIRRSGAKSFHNAQIAEVKVNDWICDTEDCTKNAPAR
jgi:hypothetical protein